MWNIFVPMLALSPCKVNIGLNLLEKRADGFHNLRSIFYPIPFGDLLEIEESKEDKIYTYGRAIDGGVQDNLIWKLWIFLKKEYKLPSLSWHLYKNVPPKTGIGAGSANLAIALKLCNRYFSLGLSTKEQEEIALRFGSDTGFFVHNSPALVEGRGDKIQAIDPFLKGSFMVLCKAPKLYMSTAEAFANASIGKHRYDFTKALSSGDISELKNDFELAFLKRFPEAQNVFSDLHASGAFYTSLSGSGSCIYGLFSSDPGSEKLESLPILWKGEL
ncbi:MAG: 4-(cytidine 5'-diphospho)-2-C-methyl-D-erythritol kinase [Luteibaculum sp.]